jgi:hypothetical protein
MNPLLEKIGVRLPIIQAPMAEALTRQRLLASSATPVVSARSAVAICRPDRLKQPRQSIARSRCARLRSTSSCARQWLTTRQPKPE